MKTITGLGFKNMESQMNSNSVNVNFRMDPDLKASMEEICARMGMSLTTALTIFCIKVEQERRIPFEITADADSVYAPANLAWLKKKIAAAKDGSLPVEEHSLIQTDD